MSTIPPIDADGAPAASGTDTIARNEGHDYRQLEAEVRALENRNREADQRHNLRFWSVIVVSALILALMTILCHVLYNFQDVLNSGATLPIILALYVAPITACTVMAASLLIAAFRGYSDNDAKSAKSAMTDATRALGTLT